IAHAEDGGAVGDDGDEIALGGQLVGSSRGGGDTLDRHGSARRIGEAEVALRRHRLGGDNFDLARPAAGVKVDRLRVRKFDVAFHAASRSSRGALSGTFIPEPPSLGARFAVTTWT